MALDYADTPVQCGAVLKNFRKIEALIDHAIKADGSTYNRRLLSQANGFDQQVTAEATAYAAELAFFDGPLQSSLRTQWENYRAEVEKAEDFFGVLDAGLSLSDADIAAGAIDYVYDTTNGVISIVNRIGYLGALYNDMITNTQRITPNGISFGSFTAKSGNRGTLSVTSMSALSHCLSGTLIFECIDETVDGPILSVSLEYLEKNYDSDLGRDADNDLNVDKSFEDGPTGLTCLIVRNGLASPTESGDDGNIFSSTVISNPKENDMSGGVLQVRVTRQAVGDTFLIEFFSSSARTSATKVGSTTANTTVGTVALDVTLKNNTRFTSVFDRANANTKLPSATNNDDDITFDIKTPRIGDRWTRTVTNDYAGNFATKMARVWPVSLPVSSGTLWTDSNAASVSMS